MMFVLSPILPLFLTSSLGSFGYGLDRKTEQKELRFAAESPGRLNGYIEERIPERKVVKAYGREDFTIEQFQKIMNPTESRYPAQIFAACLVR
jgi:ATP-binding cassette subfamily B protein